MYRYDVTIVGDFYNGGLLGKSLSFVGSSWNFVPSHIKNVDTHLEIFSSKKQVIKKLSPKSHWQTYMKWTVDKVPHSVCFWLLKNNYYIPLDSLFCMELCFWFRESHEGSASLTKDLFVNYEVIWDWTWPIILSWHQQTN